MITRKMAALSSAACLAWKCATELGVLGGSSGRHVFSVNNAQHVCRPIQRPEQSGCRESSNMSVRCSEEMITNGCRHVVK